MSSALSIAASLPSVVRKDIGIQGGGSIAGHNIEGNRKARWKRFSG